VFWPKQDGSPPAEKWAGTRYWDLSTGSRIAYLLIPGKGNKKKYPIFYLQGGPGGPIEDVIMRMMTPLAEEGYDIYLYDQIGSGLSARLQNIRDYTAERHRRDLEEIVTKTGAEKVILIGQSWGTILGVLFAADNPGKVEKMVFTGPGPIPPALIEPIDLRAPDSLHLKSPYFTNRQQYKKVSNLRTEAMSYYARAFGKRLATDAEADDFAAYLNYESNKSCVFDTAAIKKLPYTYGYGYYSQLMTLASLHQTPDPRPKLRNYPNPVLIMRGQGDNQKWAYTREFMDLFINHQLVIVPRAGHFIYLEQPKLYIKTIKEFLDR
jgi:proline iminopeptidase